MNRLKKQSLMLFLLGIFISSIKNIDAQNNYGKLIVDTAYFNGPVKFTGPVTITDSSGDAFRPMPNWVIPPPANDVIGVTTQYFDVMGAPAAGPVSPTTLRGMGVNMLHPQYMLDIYCDPTTAPPTNLDLNIGCPNCTPVDAVGYRIGGNMVLTYWGTISNIEVGVNAGNPVSSPACNDNVFVGYGANQFAGPTYCYICSR